MFLHTRNQRGDSILTIPFTFVLIAIALCICLDFFGIYVKYQKLRLVASETLTVMKINNGWDAGTYQHFNTLRQKAGFDSSEVTVDYTTQAPVNRGEEVTLEISTEYEVMSIKPVSNTLKVPIKVELTGLAQTFIR